LASCAAAFPSWRARIFSITTEFSMHAMFATSLFAKYARPLRIDCIEKLDA
jgi:hypothetical protein